MFPSRRLSCCSKSFNPSPFGLAYVTHMLLNLKRSVAFNGRRTLIVIKKRCIHNGGANRLRARAKCASIASNLLT